ncbi:MAG: AccI family restriction endonuclease [Chloroflexi bacterium]|nr:AccI family restriction endonuclease [Chloroflexota bacterium]
MDLVHTTSPFDYFLQLSRAELEWELVAPELESREPFDFLINPRRLRGSDFLMRWAQGRWSEEIVMHALNDTIEFRVLPYGPSTVAPTDPVELEHFFERMDQIAAEGKRPDLLLYDAKGFLQVQFELEQRLGKLEKAAETESAKFSDLIAQARLALEIENSLWVTEKMPGFGKPFTRYARGKNKGRLKPAGIIPTIIVKAEDVPRLQIWEQQYHVPIYVVHLFYDRGYFVRFDRILEWLNSGELSMETQRFTNPDGTAATPKQIVKVPYILCQEFGLVQNPTLAPRTFVDKNGKVMTHVTFEGGTIMLSPQVFEEWSS